MTEETEVNLSVTGGIDHNDLRDFDYRNFKNI